MILLLKMLRGADTVATLADTRKRSHISTTILGLAGARRSGVPRNHDRAGPLVLLESAGAEWFGTIKRGPA